MEDKPTTEQIAAHYTAMGNSVDLINGSKLDNMTDEEWSEIVERNKEHLRIMVVKDYWTDENMTAVNAAIG